MPCVVTHPKRHDPFPEYVFKLVPNCKHVLVVTEQIDILTRSFCNDVFGNGDYTFRSIVHNDPKCFETILTFMNTYTQDSIVLLYIND
jgi:hypothetical protein